jgi:predicted NACHT family NTPase
MAKPSLTASRQGIQAAQQALTRAGWTQKHLSSVVGCSRQPVTKFFNGDAVAQNIFMGICQHLGLDWQEVAGLSAPSSVTVSLTATDRDSSQSNNLTQELRQKVYTSIREQCGTMRVLDMSYPIGVQDIYTNVNILEQITGNQHKRIDQLLKECDADDFERFGLGKIREERIPGLEAVQTYQKLIILGKPGAGKTTFLKYLAIQCNEGNFEANRVPIFVTLKDFAEAEDQPSLLEYISYRIAHYTLPRITKEIQEQGMIELSTVLHQGKALILLDGLDEVREEDHYRVIKEIRDFSEQFWNNHFVMTCRIAAWEYTFEKFTEVEVADFDQTQVEDFAHKWFRKKQVKASTFIKHLALHPRIKQLAVSPLLLTLICLAFEESGDFPYGRYELYKEGIDALLKKWDAKRGIQRDQGYKKLSHQRKEDLLSQLALVTFKNKDYFFKQSFIEQFIADYIRNLPHINSEPDELQLDSEAIVRSIEAQHGLLIERAKGIYSFSHLTFHEYFTAREIVYNSHPLDATLKELVQSATNRRWREIFLLITEMLRDASMLLLPLKQYADELIAKSDKIQQFLADISAKVDNIKSSQIKPAALRAFYFDIDFDIDENRTVALRLDQRANYWVCGSFLTRILEGVTLEEGIAIAQKHDKNFSDSTEKIITANSANTVMLIAIKIALNSNHLKSNEQVILKKLLQRLKGQPDDEEITKEIADQARKTAKKRHHIGQEGYFNSREKELLRKYYYTIQLLVECLHSDGCMLTPELRYEIEKGLFLPQH